MNNKTTYFVAITLLLISVVTGCLHFCTECPQETLVAKITGPRNSAEVQWPESHWNSHSLVLGVPNEKKDWNTPVPPFKGSIRFLKGEQLLEEVAISSDQVQRCNWLRNSENSPQLDGFILTWGRTNVFKSMQAGETYKTELIFESVPPEGSSLWLHWIEE